MRTSIGTKVSQASTPANCLDSSCFKDSSLAILTSPREANQISKQMNAMRSNMRGRWRTT